MGCILLTSVMAQAELCGPSNVSVSRRSIPVNSPTVVKFETVAKDFQNKPDSLAVVLADDKGNPVKTLASMGDGPVYVAEVTFNEPTPKTLHVEVVATCHGNPGGHSPVESLFVQSQDTADKTLQTLAQALEAGNLAQAESCYLDPSEARDMFVALTPDARKQMAADFRSAKFKSESGANRIYSMAFHARDGSVHQADIYLAANPEGHWVIISQE